MYPWSNDPNFDTVMSIVDPFRDVKPSIGEYELARDQLMLWQVKNPSFEHLPEIEATLSLITAILKDRSIFGDSGEVTGRLTHKYYDICTFYGMSIVKFCNLLPYYEMTKKTKNIQRVIKASKKSVADLGKALNCPMWVLECRHATCHASTNSLILLRQANSFCLTWIYNNYWSKLNENQPDDSEINAIKFEALITKWLRASLNKVSRAKLMTFFPDNLRRNVPIAVDLLVQESSSRLPDTELDLGELPARVYQDFSKVLRLITSIEILNMFITELTNYFNDLDPRKARVSVLWFKVITRCIGTEYEDNLLPDLVFSKYFPETAMILWQRILYQAIKRVTKYTPEIIDHLSNLIPIECVPKEAVDLLKRLSILATTVKKDQNSIEAKKAGESEGTELFTIDDLLEQMKDLEPIETS